MYDFQFEEGTPSVEWESKSVEWDVEWDCSLDILFRHFWERTTTKRITSIITINRPITTCEQPITENCGSGDWRWLAGDIFTKMTRRLNSMYNSTYHSPPTPKGSPLSRFCAEKSQRWLEKFGRSKISFIKIHMCSRGIFVRGGGGREANRIISKAPTLANPHVASCGIHVASLWHRCDGCKKSIIDIK